MEYGEWKTGLRNDGFQYVTGQNGGGIFVLFYLIFLVCMGLPVLTMELAVGLSLIHI